MELSVAARKELLEFVTKDYEIKTNFLIKHYERMWTRFSAFSIFETALFAAIAFTIQYRMNIGLIRWIAVVGVGVSVLWHFVGTADRRQVVNYRGQIRQALEVINDLLGRPLADYPHAGRTEQEDQSVTARIRSFLSITRSPARVADGLIIFWIGVMWLSSYSPDYFQLPLQ